MAEERDRKPGVRHFRYVLIVLVVLGVAAAAVCLGLKTAGVHTQLPLDAMSAFFGILAAVGAIIVLFAKAREES